MGKLVEITVTFRSDSMKEILEWTKENCHSYITNRGILINGETHYVLYISDPLERAQIVLTWGEHVK